MDSATITAIGAAITAVLAIISPFVTTLLNNRNQRDLQKQQFEMNERYIAVKDFFSSFGLLNGLRRYEDKRLFSEATARLMLFASNELKTELTYLLSALSPDAPNTNQIVNGFNRCSELICKEFSF
jgi:hypothetical protein